MARSHTFFFGVLFWLWALLWISSTRPTNAAELYAMKATPTAKQHATALPAAKPLRTFTQTGGASWYSLPGKMASGLPTSGHLGLYAAHRSLPFGSWVLVQTCNKPGQLPKSVVVRVLDRGPFITGRIIDLNRAAFAQLAPLNQGVINCVVIRALPKPRQ